MILYHLEVFIEKFARLILKALAVVLVILALGFTLSLAFSAGADAQSSFDASDVVFEFEVLEQEPDSINPTDVTGERYIDIYAVSISEDENGNIYADQQEHVMGTPADAPVSYSSWNEASQSVDFEFNYLFFEVSNNDEVVYESGFVAYDLPHDETFEYEVESTSDDSEVVSGGSGETDDGTDVLMLVIVGAIASILSLLLVVGGIVYRRRGGSL